MKKSYNNGLGMPRRQGLYDPNNEHDACGVGLVVNIKGKKSHDIVENGLQVLEHMMHRGAEGADNKTGDGAGIMVQIPHEFILLQGIPVPEKGHYGTGLVFLPRDLADQTTALGIIKRNVQTAGLNHRITVQCKVRNTGKVKGDEIVQLYINDRYSSVTTYTQVLRGFERITLEPGEEQEVSFVLTPRDLGLYDKHDEFTVEPGMFDVRVGASSKDIRLKGEFEIKAL